MAQSLTNVVEEFIEGVKSLRVAVVGETIIDEFVDVKYEGRSMKSMCPVLKRQDHAERQMGGAAAVHKHLKDFVASCELVSNPPDTVVKTRFMDVDDKQKHVEINRFDTASFEQVNISTKDYDVVIVADFGHGFCDGLTIDAGFHLMCQTNSNNFGYNRLSKWKKVSKASICADLREASLQLNRKWDRQNDHYFMELFEYELNTAELYVTLGATGSLFCDGEDISKHESYPSEIVDTIGAGDAFFSFASLASHLKMGKDRVLIVPSLAASLSTTWLGNAKGVSPEGLMAHANRFVR